MEPANAGNTQTIAHQSLVDATNDYEIQRQQRYMDLSFVKSVDQELHDALVPAAPVVGSGLSLRAQIPVIRRPRSHQPPI